MFKKRIISSLVAFSFAVSSLSSAVLAENIGKSGFGGPVVSVEKDDIVLNGIAYHYEKLIDTNGNITVSVVDGDKIETVVNNGSALFATTTDSVTGEVTYVNTVDINSNTNSSVKVEPFSSVSSNSDEWWNYSYAVGASMDKQHGLYWCLTTKDDFCIKFDENKSVVRDYGEKFMDNVDDLRDKEMEFYGAIVAGEVNAAIALVTGITGVGLAVAALLAVGVTAAGVVLYDSACSIKKKADYNFDRFVELAT